MTVVRLILLTTLAFAQNADTSDTQSDEVDAPEPIVESEVVELPHEEAAVEMKALLAAVRERFPNAAELVDDEPGWVRWPEDPDVDVEDPELDGVTVSTLEYHPVMSSLCRVCPAALQE